MLTISDSVIDINSEVVNKHKNKVSINSIQFLNKDLPLREIKEKSCKTGRN